MSNKIRTSFLAKEFDIAENHVIYFGSTNSGISNSDLDLFDLESLLKTATIQSQKSKNNKINNFHVYELISLQCNAACYKEKEEAEIAIFSGLRMAIKTSSEFISADQNLLTDLKKDSQSKVIDYSRYKEPIGFQHISKFIDGRLEYFPNTDYLDSAAKYIKSFDNGLLYHTLTQSMELFVWSHELYHIQRRHIDLLNLNRSKMSYYDEISSHGDDIHLTIQRAFEHDADRMALYNMIQVCLGNHGTLGQIFKKLGRLNSIRMLLTSIFCCIYILLLGQSIGKSLQKKTHPNPINRLIYLITFIEVVFAEDKFIIQGLKLAVEDWKNISKTLGWEKFLIGQIIFEKPSTDEIAKYFRQVNMMLLPLDK